MAGLAVERHTRSIGVLDRDSLVLGIREGPWTLGKPGELINQWAGRVRGTTGALNLRTARCIGRHRISSLLQLRNNWFNRRSLNPPFHPRAKGFAGSRDL